MHSRRIHQAFQKNTQSVAEEINEPEKENTEKEIKKQSTGNAKALEELIAVTK